MDRYALIMAGGPGTRLWPMSRKSRPKQLLPFGPDGKSLLRASLDRLTDVFEYHNIYVIAGDAQLDAIHEDLPELPVENLIGEPEPRDTANAIGLGCAILAAKGTPGTVGVFTADHVIEPLDSFRRAVERALDAIESRPDYLGTFGIKPTWAHPGLGYVHRGEKLTDARPPVFNVREFKEKPDPATAEQYLASGEYYWNSGMFVWRTDTIIEHLKQFLPENAQLLIDLATDYGKPTWRERAGEVYGKLKKISIDFAVMEKAKRVLVVELDCQWADVGSWVELKNVADTDGAGNAVLAGELMIVDSNDNVVVSSDKGHLIATIGIKDLIVVHTEDATLICAKDQAQKIKDLVGKLDQQLAGKYT